MRVLHLSSARDFGGGERHLVELCRALGERGHEMHVAHRPQAALQEHLTTAQSHLLPLRNALDLPSAWRLARLARAHRIDILHAHLARDYPLAALAARLAPCRLILTRHVMFPLNSLHRLTLRQAAQVIAVSEAVARQVRRLVPAEKVRVIHNGLHLARFTARHPAQRNAVRQKYGFNPARLVAGQLGDLRRLKGPDDFLRAAAQIAAQRSDVSFLLAGPDTSSDGADCRRLENLVRELGLAERVTLTGWQENTTEFYQALDVFVSASHTESFGLTIIEAMAAGVPVVATATDGAREIIRDGATGKLTPVGQPAALAAAISELLNDANLRAALSTQARADVRARFSLAEMTDATERLYQEILTPIRNPQSAIRNLFRLWRKTQ